MTLYLARLTLSRSPAVETLKRLLDPDERDRAKDAHHRLIWSAFAGAPDLQRDFLWRAEKDGVFFTLSARPPGDSPFFAKCEVKEFSPVLAPGDRLEFLLRANATRTRKTGQLSAGGKEKRKHDDIVMNAIYDLPKGERAEVRMQAAANVGRDWIAAQGERGGFAVNCADVSDYSVVALPARRGARKGQPQYGVIDLSGVLTVTDPALFLNRVAQGFGRAKSFGQGLMMIRRARSD